ncbi:glycine receptor subunit alpha-4-like [Anabrus simplex]|uniref:glycine receptor subunit alpha-4-like n=1 Tax=Anabrus simplex TaxID=316456 RepID=UPI0035A27B04
MIAALQITSHSLSDYVPPHRVAIRKASGHKTGSGPDVQHTSRPWPHQGSPTEVSISLFINRVSAVDESKEEISLDVFLYVYWKDHRIIMIENEVGHVELTWEQRQELWIPDLYIRQLREMKVLSLFQEMTSLRLYRNQTMRISFGATVIIKCDMDFVLYPLDVQKCAVDFSSYKYTMADMTFTWRGDPPLSFPSDFGDGYRLPKYVVSFTTEKDMQTIYYGEGNHSTARMFITMSRELRSYLLESYLPSSLFVIMSWGSFVVIPDMVPGRMVLLVTTLLSLVTMFDTVRNNSPNALELKCIEVWLISCTLFVFFALIEYFVVLFGIRYDKHWRHKKRDLDRIANAGTNAPANSDNNTAANNAAANNHHRPITHMSQLPPLIHHRGGSRIDNLRLFGGSKVAPQDGAVQEPSKDAPCSTTVRESHGVPGERGNLPARRKFRMVAEYVVLYCGSQRGMVDQVSLVLFPVCFALFTIVYWVSYVSESRSRMKV